MAMTGAQKIVAHFSRYGRMAGSISAVA